MFGLNKYVLWPGVALTTACVALVWRLDAVADQRDAARETARVNAATVATLQAEAERTDQILTALRDTQAAIVQDSARTRRALAQVEASNEAVRSLLDTRIPDDLAGVLWDNAESRDDSADAAGEPDNAVQGERP